METLTSLQKNIIQILKNNNLEKIYTNLSKIAIDIILHVINKNYTYFVLNKDVVLDSIYTKKIYDILNKICSGIPFAYITNNASFYNYDFFVNENVLIPRFDTEIIIDVVLKKIKNYTHNKKDIKILDLGCGSGCIGLSLLKEIEKASGVFVDVSMEALQVTKINAEKLNLIDNVILVQSDWLKAINNNIVFDIIVSNPPYIAKNDLDINWNVKQYEPYLALFADWNGLYNYFKIFKNIKKYMNKNTSFFIEIGWKQLDIIVKIAYKNSLVIKNIYKDLNGINRILEIVRV